MSRHIMFRIIDRKHFDYCSSLKIKSATKAGAKSWVCNTDKENVLVKIENDVLLIGVSEIEFEVQSEMRIIGITDKIGAAPEFSDIVRFLNWVVDDDYCWD